MNSINFYGGTAIMDDTNNLCMTVDAGVLVKVFLKLLNKEGFINNKTYLAAEDKLKKGEKEHVDSQQI